jgi:hypothetical protein
VRPTIFVLGLAACRVGYGDPSDDGPAIDGLPSDGALDAPRVDGAGCAGLTPPVGCALMPCLDTCHAVCPFVLTYQGSQTNCETVGGCLVTIENGAENECVREAVRALGSGVYIGIRQADGTPTLEAGWSWACGGPAAFVNWLTVDDRDSVENGEEQCAAAFETGWDDFACSEAYPSICELTP